MIAYQLVAGRYPFAIANVQQLLNDILFTTPDVYSLEQAALFVAHAHQASRSLLTFGHRCRVGIAGLLLSALQPLLPLCHKPLHVRAVDRHGAIGAAPAGSPAPVDEADRHLGVPVEAAEGGLNI